MDSTVRIEKRLRIVNSAFCGVTVRSFRRVGSGFEYHKANHRGVTGVFTETEEHIPARVFLAEILFGEIVNFGGPEIL